MGGRKGGKNVMQWYRIAVIEALFFSLEQMNLPISF
jgi:hypothetical protein